SGGRPEARHRFVPEQFASRRPRGAPRARGNRPGGTILFGHRIEPRRDTSQGGPCARRRGRCPQRVCEPCMSVPYLEPRYEVGISLRLKKASEGPKCPTSADPLELERSDHDGLVRELVRDPVVGLDLAEAH